MTTKIQLTIAADDERCGECEHQWSMFVEDKPMMMCEIFNTGVMKNGLRCQACLDAEVKDG